MKLLTYLATSAAFIGAGICFGAQPPGAWGPLLCGVGMIGILKKALQEKERNDEEKRRFERMVEAQRNSKPYSFL